MAVSGLGILLLLIMSLFGCTATQNTVEEPKEYSGIIQDKKDNELDPEEYADLFGYWDSGHQYYLEINEEELLIRDTLKRPILQTGYSVTEEEGIYYIQPETDEFTYPYQEEPYASIVDFYYEDGNIYLYFEMYFWSEINGIVFESVEEGPFDSIIIRDEEFLDELQGTWIESPDGFYVLQIDGNHMSIGCINEDDNFYSFDEVDFHVISYKPLGEQVKLISDDLIETEFYAFTQFEYKNGELHTSEIVYDADWDTSIVFTKVEE